MTARYKKVKPLTTYTTLPFSWKFTPTKSAKPKGAVKAEGTHYFTEKS
jgi:hypothetical protein